MFSLGSMQVYDTWRPVFSTSRALSIPFATTEFGRLSLAEDLSNFASFMEEAIEGELGQLLGREKLHVMVETLAHPPSSAINPFMRLGIRQAHSHSLPSAMNDFSCIITPRPEVGSLVRQPFLNLCLSKPYNHIAVQDVKPANGSA